MTTDFVHEPFDNVSEMSVPDLVATGIAAIRQAGSFGELRDIRDKMEALRVYHRSVGAARDVVNAAAEVRVRAERRMGQELLERKAEASERQALKSRWIADARTSFTPSAKTPCAVCEKYQGICQAHHILPLEWQYERGFATPNHEHMWLCPTHHVAAHLVLDTYLRGGAFPFVIAGLPDEEATSLLSVLIEFIDHASKEKAA